jgi:F-type H+-transporting ATPase subunit epsilon
MPSHNTSYHSHSLQSERERGEANAPPFERRPQRPAVLSRPSRSHARTHVKDSQDVARYSLVSSPLSLPYPLPPLPARCEADCSSLSLSLQPPEPNPKHTHTRTHWTPVHTWGRFNKYISVAARATRQALKEEQRLAAERRAAVTLKVQHWENGKAGPSVSHRL